ncbi:MAG: peptidoglycan DD-metalloendopeptidase family protein [Candidatus Caenarcaniphilales bacterium]|nr:peptidoglycan DD-metalloendopeptidase family protein [Candidatus Caenarcaniphilales bacterium]
MTRKRFIWVVLTVLLGSFAAERDALAGVQSTRSKLICEVLEKRRGELVQKIEEYKILFNDGLISLQEMNEISQGKKEIDNYLFAVKNPQNSNYEIYLRESLERKLKTLKEQLTKQKPLLAEGLVAPNKIEYMEEEAALYNQLLEYFAGYKLLATDLKKGDIRLVAILGAPYPITSKFGYRIDPIKGYGQQFHAGIDIAAGFGTPIHVPIGGIVVSATDSVSSGGGRQIRIKHGGNLETAYMHLSKIIVKPGQLIKAGEVIGYVGASGTRVTGPHLHFEIHLNGVPVDPLRFL